MSTRRAPALAAVALMAALLAGCGGGAAPAPSAPSPISDEEAFAAAEATYRAYVDALNAVDLADPATFEPVYDLTTGDANASARESFSQMHADKWTVSGVSEVVSVEHVERTADSTIIETCVDVSQVRLIDSNGESAVSPDRPDLQALEVHVDSSSRISLFVPADGSRCN